jgi:hypothetical protein
LISGGSYNNSIVMKFIAWFAVSYSFILMKKLKKSVLFICLLLLPAVLYSQTLQLGALSSFEAYTGAGAVTNSGTFTGDAGTDNGIISGFVPPSFTGAMHDNDALTAQAKIDILRVYIHLNDLFVTHPATHAAAFGGGETITAGIYTIPAAGSIGGTITLDGGADTNAVFIIKFLGAMTVGAGSTVILSNGTRACNVFWIAEGAISAGAGSVIKGALFSHGAAISLSSNCDIEGRMLTTGGAITIGGDCSAIAPSGNSSIPVYPMCECSPASTVDVLGSVEDFALFTNQGATTNSSASGVIGNVGSHAGTLSGFGASSTIVGAFHIADTYTNQVKTDLDSAYIKLFALPNTVITHPAAFGAGETLAPGIYFIAGAGSLGGTITLDGQNDPNAVFVFKFAGAFSVAAQSKVIFTNGTNRCNVFWLSGAGVATGATALGANSTMKGTILAHGGACNSGVGGFVEGRMLSTGGAVGFSTGVIYNDPLCFPSFYLPIELLSFNAKVEGENIQLDWSTASETNNSYFNVERSADGINFASIYKVNGAGNSSQTLNYASLDNKPLAGLSYYRLKQTDFDGKTSYSSKESVVFNFWHNFTLNIYPNPFSSETTFHTTKNLNEASLMVYNSFGEVVKRMTNIYGQTFTFQSENLPSGLYYINLLQNGQVILIDKLVITD